MTSEQMAACAQQGRYWYMRADGSFYGSAEQSDADVYLLNASPEWVAQWNSWDEAVQVMTPLFARLKK